MCVCACFAAGGALLAGITVTLALVPEVVGFSLIADVPPELSLHTTWILGIITTLFGGRPGLVSGAAGALAVVVKDLVEDEGLDYLFYTVIFVGVIKLLFGLLRLGKV